MAVDIVRPLGVEQDFSDLSLFLFELETVSLYAIAFRLITASICLLFDWRKKSANLESATVVRKPRSFHEYQ